ncbi:MAG: hypothetical protein D6691_07105 [Candidatus Hydrogenedentota bacterium]|nr:MAG: hypothetical protein D6691_07105 [Candidatus Hydrogenedentota bacterium]
MFVQPITLLEESQDETGRSESSKSENGVLAILWNGRVAMTNDRRALRSSSTTDKFAITQP